MTITEPKVGATLWRRDSNRDYRSYVVTAVEQDASLYRSYVVVAQDVSATPVGRGGATVKLTESADGKWRAQSGYYPYPVLFTALLLRCRARAYAA